MTYYTFPGLSKRVVIKRQDIMEIVSQYYEIPEAAILGRKKTSELVLARHIAMYLVRKYSNHKVVNIAKLFERDHTTVLHACNAIQDYLDTKNRFVLKDLQYLENKISLQISVGRAV